MRCGIKFCGGCNPKYDRARAVEELKSSLDCEIDFEYASEDGHYDVLLVVCGCPNCCASYEQYDTRSGVVKLWDETRIEQASMDIMKSLNGGM